MIEKLKLSEIRKDDSAQPRLMLNTDHIKDLADSLEDGSDLTPVDVFYDGRSYWLADGFHRYSAYHRAKREEIPVEVHEGQLRDAVLWSITANAKHAVLKLSREEKRQSVTRLLQDEEWSQWSNREIGRIAGVDEKTVRNMRPELSAENPQIEERKVKRGDSEYVMQVKPKAETPPSPVLNYRLPVTPDEPEEDDRLEYDDSGDNYGLELGQADAEIVNDDPEEDEPYIPDYVSNPVRPTTELTKLSNEPKPRDPPFVVAYNLLGRVRSMGHRTLIDGLNSIEEGMQENALEARVKDVIEMLRGSLKQAKEERKTLTVPEDKA